MTAWAAVTAACLLMIVGYSASLSDTWSPYQRLTVYQTADNSIGIDANGVPHQGFSLDPNREPFAFYTQLDRWFPGQTYDRVLVIGAGAGNDTAVAIKRGANHIDSVEIDPAIVDISRRLNPAQPYANPDVSVSVQDGRAFLRNAQGQYDLIVYAVTDSLALVSNTANLRLESYLFTQQAFTEARDHLSPDGVLVLYNYYREPWIVEKLGRHAPGELRVPAHRPAVPRRERRRRGARHRPRDRRPQRRATAR